MPIGRSASIFGSAISPWSGLPGAVEQAGATPFSTATGQAITSGITGTAGAIGSAFGPIGAVAGGVIGIFGGVINAMLQRRQRQMQMLASQTQGLAGYQRNIGFARQGGAGKGMYVGPNAFDAAVNAGAESEARKTLKRLGITKPTSEQLEAAKNDAKGMYPEMQLATLGGLGSNMTPTGYPAAEAAGIAQRYASAVGFKNYGEWHEKPFEMSLTTAGVGAMGRFQGLHAGGMGGQGSMRSQWAGGPSVMKDVIAQAVTQGLRFGKIDEYLSAISGGVEQLGQQGLQTNVQHVGDFTRSLMFSGWAGIPRDVLQKLPSNIRMGLRAPRIAAGLMGAVGQAQSMLTSPFQAALPHFALAAAAKRSTGGGLMGMFGGLADLAAGGPAELYNELPEGAIRNAMMLSVGASYGDVERGVFSGDLQPGNRLGIPSEYTGKAREGMKLTGQQARASAAGMASATGVTNQLLSETNSKMLELLGAARESTKELKTGFDGIHQLMQEWTKPVVDGFDKAVEKLMNGRKTPN